MPKTSRGRGLRNSLHNVRKMNEEWVSQNQIRIRNKSSAEGDKEGLYVVLPLEAGKTHVLLGGGLGVFGGS